MSLAVAGRACLTCGDSIEHRARSTRTCGGRCRKQLSRDHGRAHIESFLIPDAALRRRYLYARRLVVATPGDFDTNDLLDLLDAVLSPTDERLRGAT